MLGDEVGHFDRTGEQQIFPFLVGEIQVHPVLPRIGKNRAKKILSELRITSLFSSGSGEVNPIRRSCRPDSRLRKEFSGAAEKMPQ